MKIFYKNLLKVALFSFFSLAVLPAISSDFISQAHATEANCNEQTASNGVCSDNDDDDGICIGTAGATAGDCTWTAVIAVDATGNAFERTMCNLLNLVTGTGGRAFAAFAIISVGIGFFTGKVSWGLMIGVAAGIAAIFGAPSIVAAIAGGDVIDVSECSRAVIEKKETN